MSAAWQSGWKRLLKIWRLSSRDGIDAELQFHLEQRAEDLRLTGLSQQAAEFQAAEEFGDYESVSKSLDEIDHRISNKRRRSEWLSNVSWDLRYAIRGLGKSPGFAAMVAGILALGIGANAAIFSLVDTLYLQSPRGVVAPESIRRVYTKESTASSIASRDVYAYGEYRELSSAAAGKLGLAAYSFDEADVTTGSVTTRRSVNYVLGDYFAVLGLRPSLGRHFVPEEVRIDGAELVAVISHTLWQNNFNRDPDIVGKFLSVGFHSHRIVGVSAAGFRGLDLGAVDVWVPQNTQGTLRDRAPDWFESSRRMSTRIVARVGEEEARQSRFNLGATKAIRSLRYDGDSLSQTFLGPLVQSRLDTASKELTVIKRLAGLSLLIFLISIANVSNLMLVRANVRRRETAIRLALGVTQRRLVGQFLLEGVVIASIAGAGALAIGMSATTLLRRLMIPDLIWGEGVANLRFAGFTFAAAIGTALCISMLSMLATRRADLSADLKSGARGGKGIGARFRSTLIVVQTALSLVLLVGAGMLVQSLQAVRGIDVGYDAEHLLFANVDYDREQGDRRSEIGLRLKAIGTRLRNSVAVKDVAFASMVPMHGYSTAKIYLSNGELMPNVPGSPSVASAVSPNYFDAVGIKLIAGELFKESSTGGAASDIIVSEALARRAFQNHLAVGACLFVGSRSGSCRRVAGVVKSTNLKSILDTLPAMQVYTPLTESSEAIVSTLIIRVRSQNLDSVASEIGRALESEFGSWAQPNVRTMKSVLAPAMRPWEVGATLFAISGILALVVAGIGIFSNTSYVVTQRHQEMSLRMTLGATARKVQAHIIGESTKVVILGIALGSLATFALAPAVEAMLYNTSSRDYKSLTIASGIILVVSTIACLSPAFRASRANPMASLKRE